jgi:3-methyladenine DNA glycosylase AlkD
MALNVRGARKHLAEQLRKAPRTTSSRSELQSYLGSPVPVLGVTAPTMRAILREFVSKNRKLLAREVNALAAALWAGSVLEEKALAISLLARFEKILDDASWDLADHWVDEATGWALSDSLASGPIAGMVFAKPTRFREIVQWIRAKNVWRRRASTYALHRFVRAGELDKPFQLLRRLLTDEEFWVQRAVGTWLRECWKEEPRRTEAFLRKHVRGLPRVVITVAAERAPKSFREELRKAR